MFLVQLFDAVQGVFLDGVVHTLWIGKVKNGVALAAEEHAIVNGGEKARTPIGSAATGTFRAGTEYDKAGKVLRCGAEAIKGPCANTGTAKLLRACVHEDLRGGVIECVRVHGL